MIGLRCMDCFAWITGYHGVENSGIALGIMI